MIDNHNNDELRWKESTFMTPFIVIALITLLIVLSIKEILN